jgi:exosortase A
MTARWRNHLFLLGGVIALLLLLFRRDAGDMARLWWDVSTYNHCLFILPIIVWLVWQRWDELRLLQPRAWAPGLIGVAAGALFWMLGSAGGIALFRHAALVLMLQAAIVTMLGPVASRGLMFPIFYLVFLIPFGDEAVGILQTITAKLSMIFLAMAGIPAKLDGIFITTPTGLFQVAEACSGVKFLVAMAAYATLVANVCFISWKRRIVFLIVAGIVPIIANGLRAFGTIWASELTGSTDFAASVDHIIFGWVFFAFVMALVMALGWRWFDRKIDAPWLADVQDDAAPAPSALPRAAAVIAVAISAIVLQSSLATMGRVKLPSGIELPQPQGWARANPTAQQGWQPRFDGADHQLFATFRRPDGAEADLAIAVYGWQEEGKEIVGFGQGSADPDGPWDWSESRPAVGEGRGDRIKADHIGREVATFYWIGGTVTGSETRVKLETLKARLTGQEQTAVAIIIASEGNDQVGARASIEGLAQSIGDVGGLAERMIAQSRGTR